MDLVQRAQAFAAEAYGSESELEHPGEVVALIREAGGDEELQAAAYLHDLVEDTDVELSDVEREFGPRVRELVAAMTEDESIRAYGGRKEEARCRARDAGRDAALLFVADKLSNARRMRRGQKKAESRKLGHYSRTLKTMSAAYPDLSLLPELEGELRARGDAPEEDPPVNALAHRQDAPA
ncbi:MAG TPA: HD domain-containing protein [Thermoleophilaceae bacterium]|nr:HD domain-containing protein [Thermoleophilaceae bacterium]